MPFVARILLYPIKSLDPLEVTEATVLPTGALQHDREFALFNAEGKFVNGKRSPLVHGLTAAFDPVAGVMSFCRRATSKTQSFAWPDDHAALNDWLSGYFG